MVPFAGLTEFPAHEQQLLAGMTIHEGIQQAQVGELLPLGAGHLAQQRFFQMHHFVVRQRQDEVLVEGVDDAEGQLVVVVATMHRLLLQVEQHIVHPAHVPLEAEAQPAVIGGPRHIRPSGRFLGDHHHARMLGVDHGVGVLDEFDGFQILVAAVLVGNPVLLGIIQIQHRGHRIDPQPVEMEILQAIQRIGDQEVLDLMATVVEDQRAPVGVFALAWVGVLV